jgi:post-segregation antitoxin (ccd killing protein)
METRGRPRIIADPVTTSVRVERETRDNAKTLGLDVSDILRNALTEAVDAAMRKQNFNHSEEIPQTTQRSWLGFFRWW